jgi:hypothetical protein
LTVYKGISNPVDNSKECVLLLDEGKMVLRSMSSVTMMKKSRYGMIRHASVVSNAVIGNKFRETPSALELISKQIDGKRSDKAKIARTEHEPQIESRSEVQMSFETESLGLGLSSSDSSSTSEDDDDDDGSDDFWAATKD